MMSTGKCPCFLQNWRSVCVLLFDLHHVQECIEEVCVGEEGVPTFEIDSLLLDQSC